jgi:hypothetical protein
VIIAKQGAVEGAGVALGVVIDALLLIVLAG